MTREQCAVDRAKDTLDDLIEELSVDPAFSSALDDAGHRTQVIQRLIGLRQAKKLTQAQVASVMGIGQSTVSEFEGGSSDPHLSTLQRYARAVGASVRVSVCRLEAARNSFRPEELDVSAVHIEAAPRVVRALKERRYDLAPPSPVRISLAS